MRPGLRAEHGTRLPRAHGHVHELRLWRPERGAGFAPLRGVNRASFRAPHRFSKKSSYPSHPAVGTLGGVRALLSCQISDAPAQLARACMARKPADELSPQRKDRFMDTLRPLTRAVLPALLLV